MRRFVFAALVSVALAFGTSVAIPSETASAAVWVDYPECNSKVKLMHNTWNNTQAVVYKAPSYDPDASYVDWTEIYFHLGAYASYWYCPNGKTRPAKITIIKYKFCVTKQDNKDPVLLLGWRQNAFFFAQRNSTPYNDPPYMTITWNGRGDQGDQRCQQYNIDSDNMDWYFMKDKPSWTLNFNRLYDHFPNQPGEFKAGSDNIREFDPKHDMDDSVTLRDAAITTVETGTEGDNDWEGDGATIADDDECGYGADYWTFPRSPECGGGPY